MTARQQARKAAREAREAEAWRKAHQHLIGTQQLNAGNDLVLGEEWDTSDGFRVRQVSVHPNRYEAGHFIGRIEVLGFTAQRL